MTLSERLFHRFGSQRSVLALGVILTVGIIGGATLLIMDQRDSVLADSRARNLALGTAIGEQAARSVQAVDLVMSDIADDVRDAGVATPDMLRARMAGSDTFDMLRSRLAALPQADALTIVGADGALINFSRTWPAPKLAFLDRDYFRHFQDTGERSLFVSAPVRNRGDGTWTFYLVRRLNGPDGALLGLVLGAMKPGFFESFFATVNGRPGGMTGLFRQDGTVLVRYPHIEASVGMQLPPESPVSVAIGSGGGTLDVPGDAGGPPRLISVHRLREYPLAVAVAISRDAVLEGWRRGASLLITIAVFATLCVVLLTRSLARQFQQQEATRDRLERQAADLQHAAQALRESELLLADKSSILETTLEHMDQGIMMVTADRKVALCNARAAELLDLPPALMASRPSFADVLAQQWKQQEFAFTDAALQDFIKAGGILDQPHRYDRKRPNGTEIEVRSVPLPGGGVVRTYTDITERKAAEAQISYVARHDDLTRLANRVVYQQALDHAVAAGETFAVLYMDLDRFKLVNDTRGHAVGDKLLAGAAQRMRAVLRDTDVLARMGGDEFAILQVNADQPRAAHALAARLVELIAAPYEIEGQLAVIGVSIGVALYPQDGLSSDQLLRNADTALYRAKENGRSTFRCFEAAMDIRQAERFLMEQELREAASRGQLELTYQPIRSVETNDIVCFETMLRWNHPTRGFISPKLFMPLMESSGLGDSIGRWVMETACVEAIAWARPVQLAVNLPRTQFRRAALASDIKTVLRALDMKLSRLSLELHEDLLDPGEGGENPLLMLRALGAGLTLDNFGTAVASLAVLRRFPVDRIKIDRSLVQTMLSDRAAMAIVEAICGLARRLGLEVAATGVETEAQLEVLRRLGCHLVQGVLAGRPVSAHQVHDLLRRSLPARSGAGVV